jgi:protein-S-isoprenylcysteine O-methyltransferase Ste14
MSRASQPDYRRNDLYAAQGASFKQRLLVTFVAGASLCLALWILFGTSLPVMSAFFPSRLRLANGTRTAWLATALAIYFVRLLFTQFVFLKRTLTWREAGMIAPWIVVIYLVFSVAGATNRAATNGWEIAGAALFLVGSWLNTCAEYMRHRWKQHPENRGKLYTQGLFRYSRHPNYLGDVISFGGLGLLTGRWISFAIPLIVLAGFIFVNIPMLDSHLHEHYGRAFDDYARKTHKLIPFLY